MKFLRIKENRARIDLELRNSLRRQYFSPVECCLYRGVLPRLKAYASGKLLDAGCGTMPFRKYLKQLGIDYHSLDIERRVPEVDFVGDVQDMHVLPSESYDTVLSTEVLEHVPQPERMIAEMHRVLKPAGKLILTVPYLSRLHEEPFDYFRYTRYGLQFLLEKCGFRVLEIVPTGSLFSFLGHQVSLVVVCSLWHVPVVKHGVFWMNALLCTLPCYWLDRLLGIGQKLPVGYVVVAEKPTRITSGS
jgi:SAM-dependent methyltransferase